ncbi:NAD(P)H-dependent oxidoreductase subunit E [Petroclostridium sp. X23]|uniref:(2Fe-2S) ferredoxin domain-containing protein n=1 Tax=Petroclostridium sp. X23 TaxID=3045146 RepID=UPI0024AD8A3A|nr:NAD(P)H-dependent oxidoreductase subunit E [Petroclostridium sp. X23]WHH60607.1 NAD(P)H-dependent oxidoreductase subunit E [Petroclostridium sp. X23]
MRITVCVGSSCHMKGSYQIIEHLKTMIAQKNLEGKVDLGGTFCLGNCQDEVCVTLNEKTFSLTPETTKDFFETEVLAKL